MCKVTWCNNETEYYNKSQKYVWCPIHLQHKEWVTNADTRPWLMYKLEKILSNNVICEGCGFDKAKQYPNRPFRQIVSLYDVDHIDRDLKGTLEGEQPSNYQLLCDDCHTFKSHDKGDFVPIKHRK
mgnify:CR=1 FL=1|jgi:hypothetical protein